ncbi:hypothetical protein ACQ86K_01025 [Mucilaginibacter sp. P19]|uniref:hypothetical protein n=1 Tax=Mucilaginibacter sp. P19 TaxID=3423947 RepID=UPI003D667749
MLQHLSWSTYAIGIAVLAALYYGFIGLAYYRHEIGGIIRRLTGKPAATQFSNTSDLLLPSPEIVGGTRTDGMDVVAQDELVFAAPDEPEDRPSGMVQAIRPTLADSHLLGELAEMVSETKTLIRVINESSETKENFEMLFRLVVQKYPDLAGTPYEEQVNAYLMNESADLFPFPLTVTELKSYWLNEQKLQSA